MSWGPRNRQEYEAELVHYGFAPHDFADMKDEDVQGLWLEKWREQGGHEGLGLRPNSPPRRSRLTVAEIQKAKARAHGFEREKVVQPWDRAAEAKAKAKRRAKRKARRAAR